MEAGQPASFILSNQLGGACTTGTPRITASALVRHFLLFSVLHKNELKIS